MSLKLIVDSLDSVPDGARDLYKEVDGKFRLDVDGYEDPAGLKSALQAERENAKAATRQANAWKALGKTPEEIQALLQRLETDEDTRLLADGKVDEVISKRTERMKADFDKNLSTAHAERDQHAARAKAFEAKVLDNAVLAAATKAGLHQHAIDDALFRGRAMFRLNENGDAVALDDGGNVLLGKDGKTPFTPAEWLEDMKEKAPHWFPAPASGGGAQGGHSGGHQKANFGGSKADRVAAIKQMTSRA